ncbi:MAG: NAD-dependent epimerase/dehydratase family protein, partial [Armatimonadetes bacterium]
MTDRVIVTGGAGFIGSHLVSELVGRGSSVTVIDDLSTGSLDNLQEVSARIEFIEGDIADVAMAGAFADADLVFHLAVRNVRASIGHPEENFRVNAVGTLRILEAMRDGRRGRFLYVSSSEVYGDAGVTDFSEATVPAPTTVYGAGKLAGEHIALAYQTTYGMDTRVVRPFNNYGPRSHLEGDSGEVIP